MATGLGKLDSVPGSSIVRGPTGWVWLTGSVWEGSPGFQVGSHASSARVPGPGWAMAEAVEVAEAAEAPSTRWP